MGLMSSSQLEKCHGKIAMTLFKDRTFIRSLS